jgi:dethiobiotin synthetase
MPSAKIIFVTGTDTGVGKTLLTALLLHHLRAGGCRALAMKPFCSGGRSDARLLQSLQRGELSDAEMNPFYFKQPVAPLAASLGKRKNIPLNLVVEKIRAVARKCDVLLVEGSGGLLVPLGEGYTVADLIRRLRCRVIVAARNRLGTINHTLLTIRVLHSIGIAQKQLSMVLMSGAIRDASSRTNQQLIARILSPIQVFGIPFLGAKMTGKRGVLAGYPLAASALEKLATQCNDA